MVTLLLAGHETSANALLWTFEQLARHPAVEARLLEELQTELQGRPALSGDLARLPYLKQVVQETMRLRPPVWAIARRSHRAVRADFCCCRAGSAGAATRPLHRVSNQNVRRIGSLNAPQPFG